MSPTPSGLSGLTKTLIHPQAARPSYPVPPIWEENSLIIIGRPVLDKGTSVITFTATSATTTTAAMFPNLNNHSDF